MLDFAEKIYRDIQEELEVMKKNNRSLNLSEEQYQAFTSNSIKRLSHLCSSLLKAVEFLSSMVPAKEIDNEPVLIIPVDHKLQWTGPVVGLTEVIYAFIAQRVFNNGNATVKMVASYFEKVFFVPLGNTSATFHDICQRKRGGTKFIDEMSGSVQDWIDRIDEK